MSSMFLFTSHDLSLVVQPSTTSICFQTFNMTTCQTTIIIASFGMALCLAPPWDVSQSQTGKRSSCASLGSVFYNSNICCIGGGRPHHWVNPSKEVAQM